MNHILTHQEVLDMEVQLIHTLQDKHSLSKYYTPIHDPLQSDFKQNKKIKAKLNKQFGIRQVIYCGNNCNSIFRVLTAIFMRIFFTDTQSSNSITQEGVGRSDLLQQLKCTLYSPELNLVEIENSPISSLTSTDMKKILVELFQVLKYNQGSVEAILDKYPIVQQIFILFFRYVLFKINGGSFNQQNYLSNVQQQQTLQILLDYFDITYQKRKGLYIMFEDNQYIHIQQQTHTVSYGQYEQKNPSPKSQNPLQGKFEENNQFDFEEHELDFLCDDRKQTASTPTPFFAQVNDDQTNFQKRVANAKNRRKQSLHEMKKQLETKILEINAKAIKEEEEEEQKKSQGFYRRMQNNQQIKQENTNKFMHIANNHELNSSTAKNSNIGQVDSYVYYNKDDQKFYKRKLEAIQSPIPSSPQADDISISNSFTNMHKLSRNVNNLENQQQIAINISGKNSHSFDRNKRITMRSSNQLDGQSSMKNEQINQKNIVKSFAFKRKGSHNTNQDHSNQYNESVGSSCGCSEMKAKKNSINSNVLGIIVNPDFKKKQLVSNTLNGTKVNKKYNTNRQINQDSKNKTLSKIFNRKIPNFLFKRPTSHLNDQSHNKNMSKGPQNVPHQSDTQMYNHIQKPKISFTYSYRQEQSRQNMQRTIQPMNYHQIKNHIQTEPCYLNKGQNLRSYRQHYRFPSQCNGLNNLVRSRGQGQYI